MTATRINAIQIRRVMGPKAWAAPLPFGPGGWRMDTVATERSGRPDGRVIVTQAPVAPGPDAEDARRADLTEWIHASMSWVDRVPTYDELMLLKAAVWGDGGEAYQVHPPSDRHVNIHPNALHLWGRSDGARVLPDFGRFGMI